MFDIIIHFTSLEQLRCQTEINNANNDFGQAMSSLK